MVRIVSMLAGIAAIFAPRLPAQECHGMRPARAGAIGAGYVAGEALVVAVRPADWWPGPPGPFRLNRVNGGGSPAAGQDYLLHVTATYQLSQGAALAWRWACASPAAAAWLGAATAFASGLPIRAAWWPRVAAVLDQVHLPAPGLRLDGGRLTVGVF